MFYKIVNDKVEIQKNRQTHSTKKDRHDIPTLNASKYHLCKTEYRKESFFPRTITDWNKSPENKINSTSLESFKSSISGYESSAPFFVIYKAGCEPTPYW
jgi:hypothetical protein